MKQERDAGSSVVKGLIGAIVTVALAVSASAQAAPHGMVFTKQERDFRELLKNSSELNTMDAAKKVVYFGGPVLANVKTVAVFWSSRVLSTTQSQIGPFYSAIVNSTHMDWLTEYNTATRAVDGRDGTQQQIGRGSHLGEITITPSIASTHLDDKDVQSELQHQIDIGTLPKPDDNTLYMIHFPPGVSITIEGMTSCSAFCGYHEGFKSQTYGNIFYSVLPDLGGACSFGCGFAGGFGNVTAVASHELIEAVTDPFPTPGDSPAFPQAWNTTDGSEVGDLCASNMTRLTVGTKVYTIQQEFSNLVGGCAKGPYQSP